MRPSVKRGAQAEGGRHPIRNLVRRRAAVPDAGQDPDFDETETDSAEGPDGRVAAETPAASTPALRPPDIPPEPAVAGAAGDGGAIIPGDGVVRPVGAGGRALAAARTARPVVLISSVIGLLAAAIIAYYAFVVTPLYESEARLILLGSAPVQERGSDNPLAGASATPFLLEVAMFDEYLRSPDIVDVISGDYPFLKVFAQNPDPLSIDVPDPGDQHGLFTLYKSIIDVELDYLTSVFTLKARAPSAEEARALLDAVVAAGGGFIDRIAQKRYDEFTAAAEREAARAQQRVVDIGQRMSAYRKSESFDPSQVAASTLELLAKLEAQIVEARANFAEVRRTMRPNSAGYSAAEERIAALVRERRRVRAELEGAQSDLPGAVEDFELLRSQRLTAEQYYMASLEALQTLRAEAARSHTQVIIISAPTMPLEPSEPDLFWRIALILFATPVAIVATLFLVSAFRDTVERL